jgi:hypothetical protein
VKNFIPFGRAMIALLFAAAALAPATATAQTAPASLESDKWQYTAALYGYFAAIKGTVEFPGDVRSTDFDVPFHKLLDHLEMGFMGALGVHNGRWGIYADALYMDLSGGKSQSQNFTTSTTTVPVTADLNVDIKAWVVTLAGDYRVLSDPTWTVDLLAGARMLYLAPSLDFTAIAPGGAIAGTKETSKTFWDGIVGVKGRYTFGDNRKWFVPFYLDVGTGETELTWQGLAGIGYSFHWGDLVAAYRYIDWEGKSGKALQNLSLSGPLVGVELHW